MDINTDILQFLKEGQKSVTDIRAKFGRYPRKQMFLLLNSGAVIRAVIKKRVIWQLPEVTKEEMAELTDALDKAVDLIEEYGEADTKQTMDADITKAIIQDKVMETVIKANDIAEKIADKTVVATNITPISADNKGEANIKHDIQDTLKFSPEIKSEVCEAKKSDTEEQRPVAPPCEAELAAPAETKKGFFSKMFGK